MKNQRMTAWPWCGLLLLLMGAVAQAASLPQALTLNSLATMQSRYQGQRHMQLYWSLTCAPCLDEMEALGRVPNVDALPISLINTDGRALAPKVQQFLQWNGLTGLDNWQFASPNRAGHVKLYEAIEPNWRGKVPRINLITADGQEESRAGKLVLSPLLQWLR